MSTLNQILLTFKQTLLLRKEHLSSLIEARPKHSMATSKLAKSQLVATREAFSYTWMATGNGFPLASKRTRSKSTQPFFIMIAEWTYCTSKASWLMRILLQRHSNKHQWDRVSQMTISRPGSPVRFTAKSKCSLGVTRFFWEHRTIVSFSEYSRRASLILVKIRLKKKICYRIGTEWLAGTRTNLFYRHILLSV